jgi:hypothetical protein
MKIRSVDLAPRDRQLCWAYLNEMESNGRSAQEPWEIQLVTWRANPDQGLRVSTATKVRLRSKIST